MHRIECAEFLLSRFTTHERATAIAGDLTELESTSFGFWCAVSHTAIALSTRFWLGVFVSSAAYVFAQRVAALSWGEGNSITGLAGLFTACMLLFSMIAAYSAVRLGLTDPVTKSAAAISSFSFIAVLFRGITWVPVASGVLTVLFIFALLLFAQGRKALLSILLAGAASFLGLWATWQLIGVVDPNQEAFGNLRWPLGLLILGLSSAVGIAAALPPSSVGQANSRPSSVE